MRLYNVDSSDNCQTYSDSMTTRAMKPMSASSKITTSTLHMSALCTGYENNIRSQTHCHTHAKLAVTVCIEID